MKYGRIAIALIAMVSLSSCWDFNRRQDFLDAENEGKAILIKAESEKRALIEEAKAENEAIILKAETRVIDATAKADAEVARAHGVAEANRIIGASLKGNSEYLKYLMIQGMNKGKERIYIPTEAMMPIVEVGK